MAKVEKVIDGHKLIGDVETGDIGDAQITALKMATDSVPTLAVQNGAITVDKLGTTLKSYLFPVAIIGAATIGYCKIGP